MRKTFIGVAAISILLPVTVPAQDAKFAADNLKYSRDFYSKVHFVAIAESPEAFKYDRYPSGGPERVQCDEPAAQTTSALALEAGRLHRGDAGGLARTHLRWHPGRGALRDWMRRFQLASMRALARVLSPGLTPTRRVRQGGAWPEIKIRV